VDAAEAIRQLTQGIGKNRFELEDLRSVAERLPGGMYAVAEAVGVTTEELYKQVSAGEFGTEQILKYTDALNNNLANVDFDTFTQQWERLTNVIDQTAIDLGNAGVFGALGKSIEAVTVTILGATGAVELLGVALKLAYDSITDGDVTFSNFGEDFGKAVDEVASRIRAANDRLLDFGDQSSTAFEGGTAAANEQILTITNLDDAIADLDVGTLYNLDDAYSAIQKSGKKAAEETEKTRIQLEKLASDERIKNIEANVELNVAQLESDTKIAVATIEGLASSIEGTADLLGSLFGNLLEADNFRQEFAIEDQIELENERRQQQLDQQERLNNAQIEALKARAAALRRGDSIITVNGDGLAPHLEAIMFELFEAIQIRTNADGYDLLLGA
jgi:tape measure domain-containing protein